MSRRGAGREVVIDVAEGDVVTTSSGSSVALGSPAGEAMTATGPERPARGLGLDAAGARPVSASSRWIWHLPRAGAALVVTRPGTKSHDDVVGELGAVEAARAVGVRTPAVVAGPRRFGDSFAYAFEWIDGVRFAPGAWPQVTEQLARLAGAAAAGSPPLSWPTAWPRAEWRDVLGDDLATELAGACTASRTGLGPLLAGELVLAHGDVQPANVLLDPVGSPWLIDFEYARLAPPGWDRAKVAILARRFGDPADVDTALAAWPSPGPDELATCVAAQETQIVAWLADMALAGAEGAGPEAHHRARTLGDPTARWRHLR